MAFEKNGLTRKQNNFILEYFANNYDVKTASERSNYSYDTAIQLMRNEKIEREIARRKSKFAVKCDISREQLVNEVLVIARNDNEQTRTRVSAYALAAKILGFEQQQTNDTTVNVAISTVVQLPANNR